MGIKAIFFVGSNPMSTRERALQVMADEIVVEMNVVRVMIQLRTRSPIISTPADRVICLPAREVMAPPRQVSQSTI
jgi:hypothetical protein